jgi:acetyltransferase-like isoleucine patch superfamily enzyme
MLKRLKKNIRILFNYFEFYRDFIYPNSRKIKTGQIIYKSKPNVEQLTIFTGKGKVSIGEKCSFGYKLGGFNKGGCVEIQARFSNSRILIGDSVLTNNNLFILAANLVKVGSNTLIGNNVVMMDHEAHGVSPEKRLTVGEIGEIHLGENVWIGNNVTILKNSKIGNNSIVAVGAVVNGVFPDNVIIGGVPAKIIKPI